MAVVKVAFCVGLLLLTAGSPVRAQQSVEQPQPDAFFSGTVTETTAEKISVSRRIAGKLEKRTFRVTAQTKVEGKLQPKVRVTIQYSTDEEGGSTATRIVVHSTAKK